MSTLHLKSLWQSTGAFALVFVGTGAILLNEVMDGVLGLPGIAFAFGAIIIAMIYSFHKIYGAHINPARSLGPAIVSGNLSVLWLYLIAPTLGAIVAVYVWLFLKKLE